MILRATWLVMLFFLSGTVAFVDQGHFRKDRVPKRCTHEKYHKMLVANCHDLNFVAVPTNLRSNIEILDATYNRIRELTKDSFRHYTYLQILYLEENMISYIEEGTFDSLQDLEVLDLSTNSLDFVPDSALRLPKLRKLYVNNNRLADDVFVGASTNEALEFLSMSGCHLKELPALDGFPNLRELNVSSNKLSRITPRSLAPLCQLSKLDIRGNVALLKNTQGCDCLLLSAWIQDKGIATPSISSLNCNPTLPESEMQCPNLTEATKIYNECMSKFEAKIEAAHVRSTWMIVGITMASILVVVLIILYVLHRRNVRNKSKKNAKASEAGVGSSSNNNNGKCPPLAEGEEEFEIQTGQLLDGSRT
ncbi:leucine-rich repeat-containing protein 4C-like [Periplaneta americana]|uniref:leucine-rich repeat-containing protein 4C-like n=1 Tax=Periplaneta americana TaxID=6978 RepID=UPI0037E75FF9